MTASVAQGAALGIPVREKSDGPLMELYTIGEMEKLLGVKAYILRYWEREIPLISPRKDDYGRRIYDSADARLLIRLRYLLYIRKFTIEGAKNELLKERSGAQDLQSHIDALRTELLNAYVRCRRLIERGGGTPRPYTDPLPKRQSDE